MTAELDPRPRLILGSSSPRWRELLATVGLSYEIVRPETPEVPHPGEAPAPYALRNAIEKAVWVETYLKGRLAEYPKGCLVLSADTIVVLGGDILEKPADAQDAERMLGRLSGKSHTVISGVAIYAIPFRSSQPGKRHSFTVETSVKIKKLSQREIESYVASGEPLDKAGGYAAQGIGSYMVERIEGSYANVVGLPIAEVVESLGKDFGYDVWFKP